MMRRLQLIISILFFLTGLSSNSKSPKIPRQAEIRYEDMTIVDVYYSNGAARDTIVYVPEYKFGDSTKSRFLQELLRTIVTEDGMSWRFINHPTNLPDSGGCYLTDWYHNNISNERLMSKSRAFDWMYVFLKDDPSALLNKHSNFDWLSNSPQKAHPTVVIDYIDEGNIKVPEDEYLLRYIYKMVYRYDK